MPEVLPSVKLLRVGLVAPLYLAAHFWAAGRDVAVRNAQVGKMPSELWPERRIVIRLDPLDSEGKMLTKLPLGSR